MKRIVAPAAIASLAAALNGCTGTDSQWVPRDPSQICAVNARSGMGLDSPVNNSAGLSPSGVLLLVTITYTNSAAIFWGPHLVVTLTGSNGTTFDQQLTLTTTSPIKPYWAGLTPALAPRTYYVVSDQGQPSQVIGCFATS